MNKKRTKEDFFASKPDLSTHSCQICKHRKTKRINIESNQPIEDMRYVDICSKRDNIIVDWFDVCDDEFEYDNTMDGVVFYNMYLQTAEHGVKK